MKQLQVFFLYIFLLKRGEGEENLSIHMARFSIDPADRSPQDLRLRKDMSPAAALLSSIYMSPVKEHRNYHSPLPSFPPFFYLCVSYQSTGAHAHRPSIGQMLTAWHLPAAAADLLLLLSCSSPISTRKGHLERRTNLAFVYIFGEESLDDDCVVHVCNNSL